MATSPHSPTSPSWCSIWTAQVGQCHARTMQYCVICIGSTLTCAVPTALASAQVLLARGLGLGCPCCAGLCALADGLPTTLPSQWRAPAGVSPLLQQSNSTLTLMAPTNSAWANGEPVLSHVALHGLPPHVAAGAAASGAAAAAAATAAAAAVAPTPAATHWSAAAAAEACGVQCPHLYTWTTRARCGRCCCSSFCRGRWVGLSDAGGQLGPAVLVVGQPCHCQPHCWRAQHSHAMGQSAAWSSVLPRCQLVLPDASDMLPDDIAAGGVRLKVDTLQVGGALVWGRGWAGAMVWGWAQLASRLLLTVFQVSGRWSAIPGCRWAPGRWAHAGCSQPVVFPPASHTSPCCRCRCRRLACRVSHSPCSPSLTPST